MQVVVDTLREVIEAFSQLRRQLGWLRDKSNFLLVLEVPLQLTGRNERRALGEVRHLQFPRCVGAQRLVADYAYVNLASLDVLLSKRIRVCLPMDELDALHEVLVIFHDGSL